MRPIFDRRSLRLSSRFFRPNSVRISALTPSPNLSISASTSTEDSNNRDNDKPTRQQDIETIAKEETLYHIEMAWRAQQRLVRRCLGLRLLSEEKDTSQADDK